MKEMRDIFNKCEGFICLNVDNCTCPNEPDCNDNCENYCDCSACRYEYDGQYDTCKEKPTDEEWMEEGHFYIDENGNCKATDR